MQSFPNQVFTNYRCLKHSTGKYGFGEVQSSTSLSIYFAISYQFWNFSNVFIFSTGLNQSWANAILQDYIHKYLKTQKRNYLYTITKMYVSNLLIEYNPIQAISYFQYYTYLQTNSLYIVATDKQTVKAHLGRTFAILFEI